MTLARYLDLLGSAGHACLPAEVHRPAPETLGHQPQVNMLPRQSENRPFG